MSDTTTNSSGNYWHSTTSPAIWFNGTNDYVSFNYQQSANQYSINFPNNCNAPLPETLRQIVDHEWDTCWKESKIKCFSSNEDMYKYVDSLEHCTVFWHGEMSKKVKHKTVLHIFNECISAGLILSTDSVIFLVKNE